MHRLRPGTSSTPRREVGSSVYQVFNGSGSVIVGEQHWKVEHGDLFVVPSWQTFSATSGAGTTAMDLFRFSDTPIFEALHAWRGQDVSA